MHLSENEGIEKKTFVVTGGLGFVGSSLCSELIRRGAHKVTAFDLRFDSPFSSRLSSIGVHFFHGDITKSQDVQKALRGADCVFHLASYGMSGKEMLQYGRIDEVNISGTCHVLEACVENNVKRLVYVSTTNVVFGGKEIVNGNENLPYYPLDDLVDPYSRSKSIAEQLVLKSNGRPLKKKTGNLLTCAIRPAAIYGPGEERHLPRIVTMAKLGLMPFKIGDATIKTDWVYIDNLVLALILASMGLLDDIPQKQRQSIAAGQAYFISDGSPVNSFEFIRPLLQSLKYDFPKYSISVPHALLIGKLFMAFYTVLYPWLNQRWLPQLLLFPTEVLKVGVTHYFSYLKAKQELGYVPMVTPQEGMATTISYWQDKKQKTLDGPTIYAWLFVILVLGALFAAAFLPAVGPVSFLKALSIFLFRSMWMVRLAAVVCIVAHVGEGLYAWRLAKRVDPSNARGWFWQTTCVGFFSLRILLKKGKQEIGYVPMVTPQEGMATTISYWQDKKQKTLDGPTIYTWFFVILGMSALFVAAFLPAIGPVSFLKALSTFLFRSMWMVRLVAVVSIAAHVGEGLYAWRLAKRVDPSNARGWFWQTTCLGFFSLRILLKKARIYDLNVEKDI